MLAPGTPYRRGPPAHGRRVLLRGRIRDVGDGDLSAKPRDGGLFDVTGAREPALDAIVHLLRTLVLDGDGETCQVRRERTARQDVFVVLAGVAIDGEAAHRRVAGVGERAKAEVIEELLAGIASTDWCAALRTRCCNQRRD